MTEFNYRHEKDRLALAGRGTLVIPAYQFLQAVADHYGASNVTMNFVSHELEYPGRKCPPYTLPFDFAIWQGGSESIEDDLRNATRFEILFEIPPEYTETWKHRGDADLERLPAMIKREVRGSEFGYLSPYGSWDDFKYCEDPEKDVELHERWIEEITSFNRVN